MQSDNKRWSVIHDKYFFYDKYDKAAAEACNFIKKETLAQVFSCKVSEIFKKTFFHRTLLADASVFQFLLSHAFTLLKSNCLI